MSRIFLSAIHKPLISAQASPDFADWMRETLLEIFGVKALVCEFVGDNGTSYWDFEANEAEIAELESIFKKIYESRPPSTRDVDIDLILN